jgi:uncharacterized membrane protein
MGLLRYMRDHVLAGLCIVFSMVLMVAGGFFDTLWIAVLCYAAASLLLAATGYLLRKHHKLPDDM